MPLFRIVSAGVSAGCYPKSHKWDTARCLSHVVEVREDGSVIRTFCRVKAESILADSSQYNLYPVDCPKCAGRIREMRRLRIPYRSALDTITLK